MSYFYNGVTFDPYFNKARSSLTVSATGFKINNVDICNNYTPLGTTHKLKYPSNLSFQRGGIDITQLFEFNLIKGNTASYTANIISDGVILMFTSNGDISFNYQVKNIGLYLKAGGGGGGAGDGGNFGGGGGGAGGAAKSNAIGITNIKRISCTIGEGGNGATASNNNATAGGDTTVTIIDTNNASYSYTVKGGGRGGSGANPGYDGGSGGGSGGRDGGNERPGGSRIPGSGTIDGMTNNSNTVGGTSPGRPGAGGGGDGSTAGYGDNYMRGGGGHSFTIAEVTILFGGGGGGGGGRYSDNIQSGGLGGTGAGNGGSYNTAGVNAPYSVTDKTFGGGGGGGGEDTVFPSPNNEVEMVQKE